MTLGSSDSKIDAPGKVSGETKYPGDIYPANLLHGKVVFSGMPHARMTRIDTSAAEAVPGVVAVFTAKDVPVNEYGLTIFDQPVMVGLGSTKPHCDLSLWEADHVAIIIAESIAAAEEAMQLIEIDWEELQVITDPVEARRDEEILHPGIGTNIREHYKIRKGDMNAGWQAAEVIVEDTYYLPNQEHAYLQPEAAVGYIDDENRITIEIAGQWTHEDQEQIAHALDLPPDQIRVIYPAIGGAFGGREDMSLQIVLALAVHKLRQKGILRPIKISWSREESIIGHHKRHQGIIYAKWGATKDGKITAVESEVIFDAGAYNYTTNKVLGNCHLMVSGPYDIPNARIDSYGVYTNNVPAGAFRGFGGPQGAFVAESQINKLAVALDIDPVELRMRNVLSDDVPSVTQVPLPDGVTIDKVIQRCADAADWDGQWHKHRRNEPAREKKPSLQPFRSLPADPTSLRTGRGFACAFKNVGFSFGFPERCEATIKLYGGAEIIRAVLFHAGADVGQGAHTVFRQMAAESLGISPDLVELRMSDTATSGDSGSSSASRMTFMAGNAIRGAAELALEAWKDEDRPAEGHFRYEPRQTTAYNPETGMCDPNFSYGYVAEVVDLTVDIETGHIKVDRVICADDVGKALNPQAIEGQVEGGVVQAHGYAITENLQSSGGHILNPRLSTYLIPGIQDIPRRVDTVLVEESDPLGPWGARGMAEMPFIPYAPAVVAALYDATGIWINSLPLTPERIADAMKGLPQTI